MNKLIVPSIALFMMGHVVTVFADELTSKSADSDFITLDANDDGELTQAEATPNSTLLKKFASIDTDGSGTIDQEEYGKFKATAEID